jgi:hypothetical protein
MALPILLQKLFQNGGAGDKLNTSILPAASTTAVGAARIASSAEATAGTDATKIMTPAMTKQAIDKFAPVKTVNGAGPDESGDIPLGLHAVATSGSYNDLLNKPAIPAKDYWMPNYSSSIQISKGDYTPSENGWLRLTNMSNGDYSGGEVVHKRSGITVIKFYQNRYPGTAVLMCPVKSDETYTVTNSGDVYFHRLRG